ncbi:MAG: LEPR-XLL domain-containing protein, partial [Rubrivivax sp.]
MSGLVRLARAMRDAYKLEALEPRVLLSADPVLGAAHAVVMQPVDPYAQTLDGAYDPADALAQHPGQVPHASLPDGWQDWAPNAAEPAPSGSQTFAVDARAFDVQHAQASDGFMVGTLTVAANDAEAPTFSKALALTNPGGSPTVASTT